MIGYGKRIAISWLHPCNVTKVKTPCTVIDKSPMKIHNNYFSQQNMSLVKAYKNIQHKLYPEKDLFIKVRKNPNIL